MPTVLVREVLRRASVLLQDYAPQFQRQPEIEMVDWLNDAQVAIFKFLPLAGSRIDAVKLKPGTLQSIQAIAAADCKPGDGSSPATITVGTQFLRAVNNMGADGLTPGNAVRLCKTADLDSQTPSWRTVTKTAVASYMYDPTTPRYFEVTPAVPASPAVWVRIAYTAQPVKVPDGGAVGSEIYAASGSSSQVISVADEHIDDLVNYIVARANMKPVQWADAGKAAAFTAMFTGSINAKVAAIMGNNPNLKALPMAAEPIAQASS